MRSIEGLYADRGHLEGAGLGDQELFRDDCILLWVGVEPVFGAVSEDAAVAVRAEGPPAGYAERPQPPAVIAGQLVRRPQGCGPGGCQLYETTVFLVPYTVFGKDFVSYIEILTVREFVALHFTVHRTLNEEAALYRKAVACGLDFFERLGE